MRNFWLNRSKKPVIKYNEVNKKWYIHKWKDGHLYLHKNGVWSFLPIDTFGDWSGYYDTKEEAEQMLKEHS
jgi:hypothetical protein